MMFIDGTHPWFMYIKINYNYREEEVMPIKGRVSHSQEYLLIIKFKGTCKKNGKKVYMIITYELPIVSARAIPQQINFYNTYSKIYFFNFIVGELDKF